MVVPVALLNIRLSDLPETGTQLECGVQTEELGLDPSDVQARGELSLDATILPVGDELHVSGMLSGTVLRQCVRCLAEYVDRCEVPFAVQYRAQKEPPSRPARRPGPAGQESSEDVAILMEGECYSYTGDQVDLVPMLREQVLLGMPLQPLCREDCQGLCPACGQDRNRGSCGCPEERLANPFRVLRELQKRRDDDAGSG
jgi:uncharacterized protein